MSFSSLPLVELTSCLYDKNALTKLFDPANPRAWPAKTAMNTHLGLLFSNSPLFAKAISSVLGQRGYFIAQLLKQPEWKNAKNLLEQIMDDFESWLKQDFISYEYAVNQHAVPIAVLIPDILKFSSFDKGCKTADRPISWMNHLAAQSVIVEEHYNFDELSKKWIVTLGSSDVNASAASGNAVGVHQNTRRFTEISVTTNDIMRIQTSNYVDLEYLIDTHLYNKTIFDPHTSTFTKKTIVYHPPVIVVRFYSTQHTNSQELPQSQNADRFGLIQFDVTKPVRLLDKSRQYFHYYMIDTLVAFHANDKKELIRLVNPAFECTGQMATNFVPLYVVLRKTFLNKAQ